MDTFLRYWLYTSGVLLLLTGCASAYEPRPVAVPMLDNHTLTNTSSLSNTYIVDRKSTFTFCSQPPPDAAFTQANSGNFSISLINRGDDSASDQDVSSEQQMNGRTPGVLLARELLYRLCELSRNNQLSPSQVIELYHVNLDLIKTVSSIEAQNTKVTVSSSVIENETGKGAGGNIPATPASK